MENEAFKIKNSRNEKKYPKNNVIYYLIIVIFILFISLIFCIIYIYIYHIKKNMQNNNFKVNNLNTKLSNKNNEFSLPGKNCPKTLFVKRNNYDNNKKKFEEIDTNLNISSITFFTKTKEEFREKKLKELGLKLKEDMDILNLYILPYSVGVKLKNQITKNIINKYQKINRFFNYFEYVSKSYLYDNYKKMNEIFPNEYNYMLEAYSYPEDKETIETKFKNYNYYNSSKDNLWLVKPKYGSYGFSISILKNISDIKNEYLVTKFLSNPHLIKGYKYDLRIHGLVTSIQPLKIYLYNEGLVRVATEKYDPNNQNNIFSFLTNLFLNKKNKKKFVYPQNLTNIEDSNLWNLEAFEKYCLRNNLNYTKMMEDIGDIFIKMIFSVRKKIIDDINYYKLSSSNFYHLIGFDILFDENLKPFLLEANRRCGFRDDNDAEKYYTHNIIADTINLVGIRIINKENNTIYNDTKYTNKLKEIIDDNLCELDRPRGGYSLIYPLKNNINKYKKYYLGNIPKEDEELWKNMKE